MSIERTAPPEVIEQIVRDLAAIPLDQIVESGVVGGRMWARCKLCHGSDQHDADCPWFRAFIAFGER